MATIIKIKRSSGTSTPNLGQGEIGYSWGSGTYTDAQGATVTSYGKMFLGTGTETGGIAANIEVIGGKYFTEMLDHGHGTVTANSALIVDSAKKLNELNIDNVTIDGNTISTTNSNGDLTIDTNGSGDVIISGANTSGTNLFNITDGTSTRFSVDSFSGATTISSGTLTASEELLNISSTWNNAGSTFYGIKFDVTNTASGANSRLIDLQVGGSTKFNVDLSGNVYMDGNLTTSGTTDFVLPDNTTGALTIREGSNNYVKIDTTDNSELITFGNSITLINNVIRDNVANAFVVKEGTSQYIAIDTTNGSELVKFETGNVQITGDLAVNGSDITTTGTGTATVFNTNALALSIGGDASTVNIGNTGTAARTVSIATSATAAASTLTFGGAVTGNIVKIAGTSSGSVNITSDVTTGTANIFTGVTSGTVNLATGGASQTNIGGGAATVNIGNSTGNSILEVRGNSTTGTATIRTNSGVTTANVFDTVATTGNLFGAATTVNIADTGTAARTIDIATAATGGASTLTFGGAVTGNTVEINSVTGGTVNVSSDVTTGTINIFTGVTTGTVNVATGGASTTNFGSATGNSTVNIRGNGTGGTATLGTNVTTGTGNLFAGVTGNVNIGGAATTVNIGTTGGNSVLEVRGNATTGTATIRTNSGVTTANVFDTVATTGNLFGAATTVNIADTGTAGRAIDIATAATAGTSALTFGGAISGNTFKINSTAGGTVNLTSDVTTGIVNAYTAVTTGTVNLATGGASTTNIGGAASTVNIGTTGGNSILEVRGNATTGTATIRTNSGVTTANVFDTVATTGNLFGAATTVNIADTGTAARTIDIATSATAAASTLTFGGAVTGNTVEINSTTSGTVNVSSDVTTGIVNLFTGVTTGTVNIATGGASTTNFGGTAGNSTVNIRGNGTGGTATLGTNVTTGIANVFTGVTGTINYGGSSTTHDFGSLVVKGNTISTDVVGATQLVLDPFPAGGDGAGEVLIRGNLTVSGTTTTVNSTEVSINDPIFSLGDAVTSAVVTTSAIGGATSLIVDSPVGIVETSSITGAGVAASTTITNVRTRFYTSAQMAGTQTAGTTVIYTYNTSTTAYEAIGVFASKGANFLEIDLNANISLREDDYYVGLELRDANTGTPNSATIARDPANTKVFTAGATLTLSAGLSSGITAPQEVTISQGADDNMDRGIQFKYYNAGLKTGFFGYDESGVVEGASTNYYFTYIPDATNTNNVFSGTLGSAYFKTVKVDDGITNGIAFYDAYKKLTTTAAAGTSDATTSNQILTVNGSGVPVWTTTLDGGTY